MSVVAPRLTVERRLLKEHALVIACDEVGRGALAGPVAVGAAVMDAAGARRRIPEGLRDSKLVAEHRRPDVAARAAAWVGASAVGWASAAEIDEVGIIRALGLAALRAIADLRAAGIVPEEAIVILDGNHDYITPAGGSGLRVRPIVKADRDCASAAAASVLAKVARDDLMTRLHDEHPVYRWERNKGYASLEHRDAIRAHGLSAHHRASWAIADAPTLF
ncbi:MULTISPECIES: ribonuclease HII [Microbacterium]|uniref:Ribonuclease n=1 Tax=Microbacterium hominis TaxID=162426 RepID=A0A2K9DJJ2_9MICO|nr:MULTISPECIES: ribonuclease HII [Microbacterium]AUG29667.1 ribonuclease HII [Microbacterium hominis]QOC25377.1 ribonuclease HII [Microbacterium hominis]QOC29391.1 ribonuclease HII [Microbacterium hominis]QYF98324.1 ribonuclease HII [Microbacterium sp. PAMC21962]